jgi:hypothetical protein
MSRAPHGEDEANRWIEVASCNWLHQAELLRSVLEAAGIPAEIPDEQTLGVQPFYANLLGGARLLVRPADLERARAVLNRGTVVRADEGDAEGGRSG